MHRRTSVRRVTLTGIAAAGLVALGTATASAHVTITPSTTAAGATAVLRVEVPHGCEGSATTGMTLRTPPEVTDVRADDGDGWTVTRAVDELTWTAADPLPDAEHAEVELSVRLPDDVGAELVFPVIQRCEDGEAAWTEVVEHGAAHGAHDELDRPAPVVVVTEGKGSGRMPEKSTEKGAAEPAAEPGTPSAAAAASPAETLASEAVSASAAEVRGPLVTYGALGLLAAAVLAGGAVLLRRRRRP